MTASSASAAASGLVLWALQTYAFKDGVPDVVASWIYVLVPGILAWAAGYLAPHTPRPVPPPQQQPVVPPHVEEVPPAS